MLVLCAGTEANAIAAEFWISFSFALASVPAQRTTAHALPLSGASEAPHRSLHADKSSPVRVSQRPSAFFRVLSISF